MFTGIIETKARIRAVERREDMQVCIEKPKGWELTKGQSISIDGICTTVETIGRSDFSATYMPETLRVSTAKHFTKETQVNLERSLKVGDRFEGHIVQGHVDCIGVVTRITTKGASKELRIRIPRAHLRFVAQKGSITVNGVSLTVAKRESDMIMIALIPHTLAHTNLGDLAQGDRVNIETDFVARHLAALTGK